MQGLPNPKRRPPREGGDIPRHSEPNTSTNEFHGEDEAVDAPAFAAREVIPTRGGHIGPAAAVTSPNASRASRRSPNELTVRLQSMVTPQKTMAAANVQVRRTRSASMPKGREATAPTNELTATRSPMSVLSM